MASVLVSTGLDQAFLPSISITWKAGSTLMAGLCPSPSYVSRSGSEAWPFAFVTNCQVMLLLLVCKPRSEQHRGKGELTAGLRAGVRETTRRRKEGKSRLVGVRWAFSMCDRAMIQSCYLIRVYWCSYVPHFCQCKPRRNCCWWCSGKESKLSRVHLHILAHAH